MLEHVDREANLEYDRLQLVIARKKLEFLKKGCKFLDMLAELLVAGGPDTDSVRTANIASKYFKD